MPCRFEMQIRKSAMGNVFHCAARDSIAGFLYLWSHKPTWRDPCNQCPYFVSGEPTTVERELNYEDFCKMSGAVIRSEDWEYFKAQGLRT